MEKISEKWSSNGLTSMFKVVYVGGRPRCHGQGRIYSDICGFGWRFGIEGDYSNIRIYFDPNLLQYANLGTLQVTAIRKLDSGIAVNKPHEITHVSRYTGYSNNPVILASYTTSELTTTPLFEFTVTLPTSIHLPLPKNPISPEIMRLLNNSLLGGESIDTKFYLFSRRMPGKRAGRPLPLFSSSSILKGQSSYLDTLLSSEGFKESTSVDLSTAVISESLDDKYDYASDSDLESISPDDLGDGDHLFAGSDIEDTRSLPSSSSAMELPFYSPTSDGSVSNNSGPTYWPTTKDVSSHSHKGSRSGQPNRVQQCRHRPQMGRMIFRKHTAFATWRAFLFYLHTKEIKFSTLKSKRTLSPEAPVTDTLLQIPSCSPKSMYRLADELGMNDLKELAFQAIASGLTDKNVVQELFSSFTSRYPPIRTMEINALGRYYNTPGVVEQIKSMVPLIVTGSHPHTLEVVTFLLSQLNPDGLLN